MMLRFVYTPIILLTLLSPAAALAVVIQQPSAIRVLLLLISLALSATIIPVVVLRWRNPQSTYFMRNASAILRRKGMPDAILYQWVDYRAISPDMRLAAVAGEDVYFPYHSGFDWESLYRAYQYNKTVTDPQSMRGASTISQQVAKNLFLPHFRSYIRKLIEAYFTILIEGLWPKRRILEVYLNIVQLSANVFGVEAAARQFFNKTAAELGSHEAALLVAVLPSPVVSYDVTAPSHIAKYRQVMILSSMKKLGHRYLTTFEGGSTEQP